MMNTKSIPALTPISRHTLKNIATNVDSNQLCLKSKFNAQIKTSIPNFGSIQKHNLEKYEMEDLHDLERFSIEYSKDKRNDGMNRNNSNIEKSSFLNMSCPKNVMKNKNSSRTNILNEGDNTTATDTVKRNDLTYVACLNNSFLDNNNSAIISLSEESNTNSSDIKIEAKEQDITAMPDSTTQVIKQKIIQQFNNGEDVLVHHKDGRYYLGTIIAVDQARDQCLVKFGDNTERWSNVRELTRLSSSENDCGPICVVCKTSTHKDLDKIIACDKCGRGYHQKCHTPKVLNVNSNWNCRRCVDQIQYMRKLENKSMRRDIRRNSNTVEIVSPIVSVIPTQVPQNQLPYNLADLTWDMYHRVNVQQTYCYCGANGEWYSQMLQCARCRQWFHERCVSSLQYPLYCGDRFYVFVCSICNYGSEFVRRLEMKWIDLVHLLLFNLTAYNNTKYYDLDNVIVPYANDNWHALQLSSQLKNVSQQDLREQILTTLMNGKNRFICGRENKKKVTIWGLRLRLPPPAPCVTMGFNGVVTDAILRESWKGNRKLQFLSPPSMKLNAVNRSNSYPGSDGLTHTANDTRAGTSVSGVQKNMIVPLDSNMLNIMMGKAYRRSNDSDSESACSTEMLAEQQALQKNDGISCDTDVKCFKMEYTGDAGFVKKPILPQQQQQPQYQKKQDGGDEDVATDKQDDDGKTSRKSDELKLILKIDTSNDTVSGSAKRKRKNLRKSSLRSEDNSTSTKSVCPPTPPTSVSAPPTPPACSSGSNDANVNYYGKSSTSSSMESRLLEQIVIDPESKEDSELTIPHLRSLFDSLKSEFRNDLCDSSDETSSRGTLDSIIPPPKNFKGKNNPFHSPPQKTNAKSLAQKDKPGKSSRKLKKKSEEVEKNVGRGMKRQLCERDMNEENDVKRRNFKKLRTRNSLPETTASKTASYTPMLSNKDWTTGRSLRSSLNTSTTTAAPRQSSTQIPNCVDYALNGRRLRQRQDITYAENGRRNSSGSNLLNNRQGPSGLASMKSSNPLPTSPHTSTVSGKVSDVCMSDLKSSVNTYFGAVSRILNREQYAVQGRRVLANGRVQYLIEWGDQGQPS